MTHEEIVGRVETRIADHLSVNVRGFDGVGFERHAEEEKATTIPPVLSPVALAFQQATQR